MKTIETSKIAFIHDRQGPHPSHRRLAESIKADFYIADRYLPIHSGLLASGRVRTFVSWILNTLFFQDRQKYDLIMTDSIHFPPVLMRRMKLLRANQKLVAMFGSETLYFLHSGYYKGGTKSRLLSALGTYDAVIGLSKMQADLAVGLTRSKRPDFKVYTAHELISADRYEAYGRIQPKLEGKNILFIGNGPGGWKVYYKGLETLVDTFRIVSESHPEATLTVVGDWTDQCVSEVLDRMPTEGAKVQFVGIQTDLTRFLNEADLYLHLANGDAFPISILEALRSGVPAIVSDATGTKEVIEELDPRLVVPARSPEIAAATVAWYFDLPLSEKMRLSAKGRERVKSFSEESSIAEFHQAIGQILSDI